MKNSCRLIVVSLLFCFVGCFGVGEEEPISQIGPSEVVNKHNLPRFGPNNMTSLMVFVSYPNSFDQTQDALSGQGINVNVQSSNGKTALMHAVSRADNLANVQALLNHDGIDVNLQDTSGNTALRYAVSYENNNQNIEALLNAPNINVNKADDTGATPLMYALKRNKHEIVSLFREHVSFFDMNFRTKVQFIWYKNEIRSALLALVGIGAASAVTYMLFQRAIPGSTEITPEVITD